MAYLPRFGIEPAQDAIESDDEIDAAERRVELLEHAGGRMSRGRATVNTSPSSMAQKNERLPSGFMLRIERQ
jgi:hypothetical protein